MGRLTGSRSRQVPTCAPGMGFSESTEALRQSKLRKDKLDGDSVVEPRSIRRPSNDPRQPKQDTDRGRDD
jgi:hypothetical protein